MTSLERALEKIIRYVEQRMAGARMPGPALGITDPDQLLRVATFRHAGLASSVDGAEPGVALGRVLEGPGEGRVRPSATASLPGHYGTGWRRLLVRNVIR